MVKSWEKETSFEKIAFKVSTQYLCYKYIVLVVQLRDSKNFSIVKTTRWINFTIMSYELRVRKLGRYIKPQRTLPRPTQPKPYMPIRLVTSHYVLQFPDWKIFLNIHNYRSMQITEQRIFQIFKPPLRFNSLRKMYQSICCTYKDR